MQHSETLIRYAYDSDAIGPGTTFTYDCHGRCIAQQHRDARPDQQPTRTSYVYDIHPRDASDEPLPPADPRDPEEHEPPLP